MLESLEPEDLGVEEAVEVFADEPDLGLAEEDEDAPALV